MTPTKPNKPIHDLLAAAQKALSNAQNRLGKLELERGAYAEKLEAVSERERTLRRERNDLPALTTAHAEINALRSLLEQIGLEIAELSPQLETLEQAAEVAALRDDLTKVSSAAGKNEAAIKTELDKLTTFLEPVLATLATQHSDRENLRATHARLAARLASTGQIAPAELPKLEQPTDADHAVRGVWQLYTGVSFRHEAQKQIAAERGQREAVAERQRRREEEEHAAELVELSFPAKAEDILEAAPLELIRDRRTYRVEGPNGRSDRIALSVYRRDLETVQTALKAALPAREFAQITVGDAVVRRR